MRIWILSDLHTEVADYHLKTIPEADLCIAAGDIARGGIQHVEWLRYNIGKRSDMTIVSVLGNHEFYGSTLERERVMAGRYAPRADVNVLDNAILVLGDVRIIGCTLWTDYDLHAKGDPDLRSTAMKDARRGMNDHERIFQETGRLPRFQPSDALALHKESRQYLEAALAEPFDGQTIIVTHHCPHPNSVAPRWQGDPITPSFTSDLGDLIARHQPELWVHGHTHDTHDYHVGRTRVICNPRGYGQENARGFNPNLVIEI